MAEKLGLTVNAEGRETTEQLKILQKFGCPYGQDYLFLRAVPADAFAELYQDQVEMSTSSRKGDRQ